MRIRHLQSHLSEQNLINQGNVKQLSGLRLGVDAVFWLRSIQALKDPFADALGGIPPGIFGFVDKELDQFKKAGITPIFVFQGIARPPQQQMFLNRTDQHTTLAWTNLAKGLKSEAQKCFAVSTSRINSDFVYFIFHHLKNRGYECFQAPYFAGAQLAHFSNEGMLHAAFASPGLLLYGVAKVLIHIEFHKQTFSWLDLSHILGKWEIELHQFIDSCMMAGTEYCLTYPFLNFENFPNQAGRNPTGTRFNFDAAVSHIKQTPLINWLQSFPTPEMKADHFDGYCVCKVLIQHSPVLHVREHVVKPLVVTQQGPAVPSDYVEIVGDKLPNALYLLMCRGAISAKLPQALAKGEWTDKSQPLVDTQEYRQLIFDLEDYREKALGLVARHLHPNFHKKTVICKAYFEGALRAPAQVNPANCRTLTPLKIRSLRWKFSKEAVAKELERQGSQTVDFKFCLNWHSNEYQTDGALVQGLTKYGDSAITNADTNCLSALVHFMLLEHLELISEDGGMTVLGDVLKETPSTLQEPCLVALEMMKFGMLSGEPFDAATPERPFPSQVQYPSSNVEQTTKATLLLCRVLSLVPMKLRSDMWNADVNFDLAAFHSLVRALKRSLRQLTEACLTSILLRDLSKSSLLPPGFMCASPNKDDQLRQPALLPTFMLTRACMGIVATHFLTYRGEPQNISKEMQSKFPCCVQPLQDLQIAFDFWEELKRCVDAIAEPLGAMDLKEDMDVASSILSEKRKLYKI
eukprot:GEMP01004944.1.p1 GENE.GEMP01004944.1~~GEMP01004944.1.p1  ORF type:complete len:747 (+),score=110.91 GEMP01004944.1:461-2701(+)